MDSAAQGHRQPNWNAQHISAVTSLVSFCFKCRYDFGERQLRSVVAESVLMRHQVLVLNRGRKRAPNLRASDRILAGLCTLLMRPARVLRSAVVLKPSTLLNFQKMLVKQKYRLLFSPKRIRRPGPKGPTKDLIDAVVVPKNVMFLVSHCRWLSV